ncbi:zinc-binding alcohol dehydrogenase family protein [Novosphingobium sp. CCH12-A3]|uniref:quinone oxidoreductase family protein n=1 Tax=Novosphingobium sp. CCH12-A3 TaxID=1768752 RepID=UPI0007857CBE|nr:zinc-binding alcohol dehydrogenase family protein [Novosphingobium sp. CCH12-A3]
MQAAIIAPDGSFSLADHAAPQATAGAQLITVAAAGIGPTDLMRAKGFFGPLAGPYIPGGEGVGALDDGTRVYFGHSIAPFGAMAEQTLVSDAEVWPIPAELADDQVIGLAISGTGALIPMEEARIRQGDNVLILGATGPVGQVALQLARIMGAGHIVAAARSAGKLAALEARGWADASVQLGTGDDDAMLKAASNGGFDVVLDVIYGPPAEAAMRATRPGARMMSIGVQAGPTVTLSLRDLVFRSHIGVGTGQRPAAERRAAFERLMKMAAAGTLAVDTAIYPLNRAEEAWAAQAGSPHAKIVIGR